MSGLFLGGLVGAAVGVSLVLLGWRWGRTHAAFRARAIRVSGRIVALSEDDDVNAPTVEFRDRNGRLHRIEGKSNAGRGDVVGSTLTVYYEPKSPGRARLEQDMIASTGVTVFLGVVIALAGLAACVTAWALHA